MSYSIEFDARGDLWNGQAKKHVEDALTEARYVIGNKALSVWHTGMEQTFRHPTPYYETQVINQTFSDYNLVHDRGIVYGPWLEGVGSRNRTTRFKGYFNLRRAASEAEAAAPEIVERILSERLGDG